MGIVSISGLFEEPCYAYPWTHLLLHVRVCISDTGVVIFRGYCQFSKITQPFHTYTIFRRFESSRSISLTQHQGVYLLNEYQHLLNSAPILDMKMNSLQKCLGCIIK